MNMSLVLRIVLLSLLGVALCAPFTFLKPKGLSALNSEKALSSKDIKASSDDGALALKKEKPTIKAIVKPAEKPLHKVNLPDFASISDIPTKKRAFFDFIRPAVDAKNNELLAERSSLEYWHEQLSLGIGLTFEEEADLQRLIKEYRINEQDSMLQQVNDLLTRVDVIPTSLVLVQAANESAWGTSRFARVGLNFFGIWCYRQGCGMVPGGRNTGAKHEVAAFQSVDDSVSGYFNNINKHNAYHVFRIIRSELRAQNQPLPPEVLATGLFPYSERGTEYVVDITNMLRYNQRYFINRSYNTVKYKPDNLTDQQNTDEQKNTAESGSTVELEGATELESLSAQ